MREKLTGDIETLQAVIDTSKEITDIRKRTRILFKRIIKFELAYLILCITDKLILNLLILCDRTIKLSFITQDPGVIIAIFQMLRILVIIGDLALLMLDWI